MSETLMTDTSPEIEAQVAASAGVDDAGVVDPVEAQGSEHDTGSETPEASESQKADGAPEAYEPFMLPEGIELSESLASDIQALAKDMNLPQEQAQKLADMAAKYSKSQSEALSQAQASWVEAAEADKEFGGQALSENMVFAKKALDTFGTPELRSLLNESGLGNHPEIIRAFYRAGKAISEDSLVSGRHGAAQTDPAKRLFPNQA